LKTPLLFGQILLVVERFRLLHSNQVGWIVAPTPLFPYAKSKVTHWVQKRLALFTKGTERIYKLLREKVKDYIIPAYTAYFKSKGMI